MKLKIFLILIFINAVTFSQNETLNKKWLQQDRNGFIKLTNFINSGEITYTAFKNRIKKLNIGLFNKPFYGLYVLKELQPNGYISFKITILKSGKIGYFKAFMNTYDVKIINEIAKNDKKVALLLKSWKPVRYFDDEDGMYKQGMQITYSNKKVLNKYFRLMDRYFGKKDSVSIKNVEVSDAYHLLLYPYDLLIYGYTCSPTKVVPNGRKAIQVLVKYKRFDLIKNILKAYTAEGRAYALEALIKNNKIDEESKRIINKLLKIITPILTCDGCFMPKLTYKEIYDKLVKDD